MGHVCAVLGRKGDSPGSVQPVGRGSAQTRRTPFPPSPRFGPASNARTPRSDFAWLALGNAGIDMPLPLRLAPSWASTACRFSSRSPSATVAVMILRRGRRQIVLARGRSRTVAAARPSRRPRPAPKPPSSFSPTCPKKNNGLRDPPRASARSSDRDIAAKRRSRPARDSSSGRRFPARSTTTTIRQFREEATNLARVTHAYFLFGTVARNAARRTAQFGGVAAAPTGDLVDRYDKINLVPFGEYVPQILRLRESHHAEKPATSLPAIASSFFRSDDHSMGVFICYESAFPPEVRQFAKLGANLLVNISNDGYFGHSAAREQHLEIARMRAVENRRWLF